MQLTAEQWQTQRWEREVEQRNRALSDEELDSMMPTEGYKVLEQPAGYAPIRTPARKLMATPTPLGGTPMYQIPEEDHQQKFDVPIEMEGLPEMKPEDQQYFGKLLKVHTGLCILLAVGRPASTLLPGLICLCYFRGKELHLQSSVVYSVCLKPTDALLSCCLSSINQGHLLLYVCEVIEYSIQMVSFDALHRMLMTKS